MRNPALPAWTSRAAKILPLNWSAEHRLGTFLGLNPNWPRRCSALLSGSGAHCAKKIQGGLSRLRRPEEVCRRWLGKTSVCVAWLGLLLATFSPPHGTGFSACWFKVCTGFPCPGCGLTRSLSCGLRGMFLESWQYHPMGLLILGLFATVAVVSLLPRSWQERLMRHMESRAVVFNALYLMFVVTFISFGAARALLQR